MCSFFGKHQITQVTQPPYSSDLAPCDFWLFPKLKSPLKGRDFRTLMRFRKIRWAPDGDGENYVRSQGAYFEGDWGIIVLCTMFLVFSSISTFWTDLETSSHTFLQCDWESSTEKWVSVLPLLESGQWLVTVLTNKV